MNGTLNDATVQRYLALLGVEREGPSLGALEQLVAAHLTRIPFENVSKLLYWHRSRESRPPAITEYLNGIEQNHFGGTCYANNFHLYSLLKSLGYDVRLCGADMSAPDVHMASIVNIGGREYIVDVGYAAPLLAPLPRDLDRDYIVELGRDRYVLRPQDDFGRSRLDLYRDGILKHGYTLKPQAKSFDDFRSVIDSSFRPDATFLNALLLVRFFPESSITIHNLTVIESRENECQTRVLANRGALVEEIERTFGIPAAITAEAVKEVRELRDAWG